MQSRFILALAIACLAVVPLVPSDVSAKPAAAAVVRLAAGPDAASIQGAVNLFRLDLGGGNVAGPNGSFGGLRREINWDGTPDAFSAPNNLPANFFNVNSPRGVVFATPGTGFQVSSNPASGVPLRFGNINPNYTNNFQVFSSPRLFTALGSNITDVLFFVPSTNIVAGTNGFGVVFTNVISPSDTSVQFVDQFGVVQSTNAAPVSGPGGLSFVGVSFNAGERITRVRITSGGAALGAGVNDISNGGTANLVVMDDLIYGEPQGLAGPTPVVPELPVSVLFGSGLAITFGLALLRSRGRKRPGAGN